MNWEPIYALLIFTSTALTFVSGLLIEKSGQNRNKKRLILSVCLLINLGILFSFKYFNFINESVFSALEYLGIRWNVPNFDILLPVGISFYTFQAIGYSIDVYRGTVKAESHFGMYALFVSYFPQLVAGPIERTQNLLHQFREKHYFNADKAVSGLRQMLWGLLMKVVIADRVAIIVNAIYNNNEHHNGTMLLYATFLFAIQVYCDFAGYSNIAIGASRIMGIDLMENFRRPYFATSIKDFWSRWHISLSTWFKDYVYIPLGGNRVKYGRHIVNLFITFLVSGIWHGANWTFFIWGAFHGGFIVLNHLKAHFFKTELNNNFVKVVNVLSCFVTVCFAWIFFRASSALEAFNIIRKIFTDQDCSSINLYLNDLVYALFGMLILFLCEFLNEYYPDKKILMENENIVIRYASYILLLTIILMCGVFNGGQFIYFQF